MMRFVDVNLAYGLRHTYHRNLASMNRALTPCRRMSDLREKMRAHIERADREAKDVCSPEFEPGLTWYNSSPHTIYDSLKVSHLSSAVNIAGKDHNPRFLDIVLHRRGILFLS